MKKYKFIEQKEYKGVVLNRIVAIRNFSNVTIGECGGWIKREDNLSHFGDAWVYGNAMVYGNVLLYGNAEVYGDARVCFGELKIKIETFREVEYISSSLNIFMDSSDNYILYKKVNKIKDRYFSCWDNNFEYIIGNTIEEKNFDPDIHKNCSSGLHVSTPFFWADGNALLQVLVNYQDIITCQDGKIRCKKLKVLREVEI